MFEKESGLLQGTVELLVLKTLSWGPMHGYGVASWIESATDDVLRVEEGSLYPALYRMTRKGWIKAQWGITEKVHFDIRLDVRNLTNTPDFAAPTAVLSSSIFGRINGSVNNSSRRMQLSGKISF